MLDRPPAQVQPGRDGRVREALDEQVEDVLLAGGEGPMVASCPSQSPQQGGGGVDVAPGAEGAEAVERRPGHDDRECRAVRGEDLARSRRARACSRGTPRFATARSSRSGAPLTRPAAYSA
ncbi:MAG: hypothetical protein ABS81_13290 [Pseudonocardia sp. SCN 72-86]|nr:MAG: hypothetical protein ABS81_13290 [Pseudonocardia sp. SCN 72-86]